MVSFIVGLVIGAAALFAGICWLIVIGANQVQNVDRRHR